MKRDWGFWGFWITVAGVAVAAGLGLPSLGYPAFGRWLFYARLTLSVLLVFGVLSEWAAHELAPASNQLLRALWSLAKSAVEFVAWLGALPLAPVVRRLLREQGLAKAPTLAWTAEKHLGQQGSDFFPVAHKGYRVTGVRFIVRPDRAFPQWHAGFRLTPATDNLLQGDLRATVLVQVEEDAYGKLWHRSHLRCADWGPWGLTNYNPPKPSYEFDVTICKSMEEADRLQLVYSIDGDTPQAFSFPAAYAEQIVFVAWADGKQFRVHFEQISMTWAQIET